MAQKKNILSHFKKDVILNAYFIKLVLETKEQCSKTGVSIMVQEKRIEYFLKVYHELYNARDFTYYFI